jgi:hypothetical protein
MILSLLSFETVLKLDNTPEPPSLLPLAMVYLEETLCDLGGHFLVAAPPRLENV